MTHDVCFASNPTKTLEQKMGLPSTHAIPISVVVTPEPRRWLSRFFFAGLLDKTEKSGTVPAAWVYTNPKVKRCINASLSTETLL